MVWRAMPFEKNQNSCHGSQIGYQNRMIQAILNVHVAPIPQTKFRFNLTLGWERWSLKDIKMATMVVILYIPMEQVKHL